MLQYHPGYNCRLRNKLCSKSIWLKRYRYTVIHSKSSKFPYIFSFPKRNLPLTCLRFHRKAILPQVAPRMWVLIYAEKSFFWYLLAPFNYAYRDFVKAQALVARTHCSSWVVWMSFGLVMQVIAIDLYCVPCVLQELHVSPSWNVGHLSLVNNFFPYRMPAPCRRHSSAAAKIKCVQSTPA